jgi:predicted amidohydrolase YtcJ
VSGLLVRDAELDGGRRADVRIAGGRIAEIAPRLEPRSGEDVLDARGGALLPGLCDHHLHLHALAAHAGSVLSGPPAVTDAQALADALSRAVSDEHGWVRGVGYVDTVAGDLDATALDRLHADRPVRVQHRSGALWTLNSAAVTALNLAGGHHPGIERDAQGEPTGRLWRADDWLRTRLPGSAFPSLTPVGVRLTGFGITSVTDATPDLDAAAIGAVTAAMAAGSLPQHVHLLGCPLGQRLSGSGHVPTTGPYKIVVADSALPGLDALAGRIAEAHAQARAVAVHCVSREALVLLLAAFADVGVRSGDRVEHAAVVPSELVPTLAQLGLRVVTQPGFLAHRGDDYLRDVPEADHADLYRCHSLLRAGIPLAMSSDAPYGPLDPWAVMAAAAERRTPSGRVAGPTERLTVSAALNAYLTAPTDPGGPPRRVRTGAETDVVLLHVPLAEAVTGPSADLVRATVIAGALTGT